MGVARVPARQKAEIICSQMFSWVLCDLAGIVMDSVTVFYHPPVLLSDGGGG